MDSPRWDGTVERMYGKTSNREFIKKLDFYQVMGNHDHRGNATVQIAYSLEKGKSEAFRAGLLLITNI